MAVRINKELPSPAELKKEYPLSDKLKNIKENNVKEIILALSSTIEGETTALYIAQLLKNSPIKVTRLAYGLPLGADLEYVDEITISRSLEGRTTLKGEEK